MWSNSSSSKQYRSIPCNTIRARGYRQLLITDALHLPLKTKIIIVVLSNLYWLTRAHRRKRGAPRPNSKSIEAALPPPLGPFINRQKNPSERNSLKRSHNTASGFGFFVQHIMHAYFPKAAINSILSDRSLNHVKTHVLFPRVPPRILQESPLPPLYYEDHARAYENQLRRP